MIKCVVLEEFTLNDYDKLKNIKRSKIDTYGRLYVNDEFECDEAMAKYLTGGNDKGKVVVKIIEVKEEPKLKSEAKKVEEHIIPSKEKIEELNKELEEHIEIKPTFDAKLTNTSKVGAYPIRKKKVVKK